MGKMQEKREKASVKLQAGDGTAAIAEPLSTPRSQSLIAHRKEYENFGLVEMDL